MGATNLNPLAKPDDPPPGKAIIVRRHVEWSENRVRWQWLMDSYEGGERYRNAVYGRDRKGLPVRNLSRHKREYPDVQEFPGAYQGGVGSLAPSGGMPADVAAGNFPGLLGADANATVRDDDYELRRSRTPVPNWLEHVVETHLGKIYDQEVKRKGPDELQGDDEGWWADVDGSGTRFDEWMAGTIAPLLLVLGQIDVLMDHPPAPEGESIETKADVIRLGLDRCVASYILPENMLWWKLDAAKKYKECLVQEYVDPSEWAIPRGGIMGTDGITWARGHIRFRHWEADRSCLYDYDGNLLAETPHPYGRVPIVRLIDQKNLRTPHCGKARWETVAQQQREYYNRDSELILSDTIQAHPLLSGSEKFCQADGTLSVGPNFLLPIPKDSSTGEVVRWEYVSPPKDPAESLRKNKLDIVDQKDTIANLTKPAGVAGSSGGTVAQSGISKQLDATTGSKTLTRIGKSLSKSERHLSELALIILNNGTVPDSAIDAIKIVYPSRFELFSVQELVQGITEFQAAVAAAGEAPLAEKLMLQLLERMLLPGLGDPEYDDLDEELDGIMEAKAKAKEAYAEMGLAGALKAAKPGVEDRSKDADRGSDESQSQADPTGVSGATAVTNTLSTAL